MDKKKSDYQPSRLLNRNGELNIYQSSISSQRFYNLLITSSWQRILALALVLYILINIIFTILYYFAGGLSCLKNVNDHPKLIQELTEIFFFSTQTFTTVGYGHVYPECLVGNLLAAFESFMGLMFFAIITGLFLTKFTQPRVEISLSDVAVFDTFSDGYGLKFMLANEYDNKIVDVEVTLDLIKLEMVEGKRYKKRFYQLYLFRKRIPYLSVPWTVVHVIDEKSPLYGISKEDLRKSQMELFVQIKFFDENLHRWMFKEFSYFGEEEMVWGHKFINIQNYTDKGVLKLDMERFGETIALEGFPEKIE